MVAINSAIEIDLTGQVCADSIGHRVYSGIGGQMDFIRGAALSKEGKPIVALPSTAAGGHVSRIVVALKPGAGVVTTRGHVQWVATEYGAVNLHGLGLRQRAEALISIAHPISGPSCGVRRRLFGTSSWPETGAARGVWSSAISIASATPRTPRARGRRSRGLLHPFFHAHQHPTVDMAKPIGSRRAGPN